MNLPFSHVPCWIRSPLLDSVVPCQENKKHSRKIMSCAHARTRTHKTLTQTHARACTATGNSLQAMKDIAHACYGTGRRAAPLPCNMANHFGCSQHGKLRLHVGEPLRTLPCRLLFLNSPMYFLPSAHVMTPSAILSLTKEPSNTLPLANTNRPCPKPASSNVSVGHAWHTSDQTQQRSAPRTAGTHETATSAGTRCAFLSPPGAAGQVQQ